jgi:hypothetical protein
MTADLSTPELALAALEDAYARRDLDAAVAAKDFKFEARAMLLSLPNLTEGVDDALVSQAADVLELAFRQQIQVNGFPDFGNLTCRVISKRALREDLFELIEECVFPDGGRSRQTLHAAQNARGWHIVILPTQS